MAGEKMNDGCDFFVGVVHAPRSGRVKRKKELRIAQLLLSTVDQLGLEPRTSRL